MKVQVILCFVVFICASSCHKMGIVPDSPLPPSSNPYYSPNTYTDPALPIPQRIENLLAQMTLQEKVNQLLSPVSLDATDLVNSYKNTSVGSWIVNATANVTQRNEMQQVFLDSSRLHIPISFTQEGLHGGCNFGTIYPMPVGMTSSWNLDLIVQVHKAIAQEIRACGADRSFSSNINVYTDPRFGRTQEGWGEDPFLVSQMATATVIGLQGTIDPNGYYNFTNNVVSEAKHFASYGHNEAGQDGSAADISERTFREIYLAPWKAVTAAGVGAIMPSHNEIFNGIPSHGNYWLLTEVLREELGWTEGLVASDFSDIGGLVGYHLAANVEDAAVLALQAGVDQDLGAVAYFALVNATLTGKVSMDLIDRSVRNVLRQKFATGLFDTPITPTAAYLQLDNPQNRQLARTMAQQSIVLLKNDNNILPLNKSQLKSIALIGPNVNDWMAQTGGYTNYGAHIVTPLEAIQNYVNGTGITVQYAPGANVMNDSTDLIPAAIKLATQSDIAILFVGDNQDTCEESWGGRTGDTPDLDIPGGQLQLIDAIVKTGVKTVVVLISGRPATFGEDSNNTLLNEIHALVEAWRPGEEGGNAIVDILFGDVVPTGKLALTFPWSAGQVGGPAHPYYKKFRQYDGRIYNFQPSIPLFPFGFGLSYTTYQYSNLTVSPQVITTDEAVTVTVDVKNTGSRNGEEIVQMYYSDVVASVVRYNKQLVGFQRVAINAGQTATVTFKLSAQSLAFYNSNMELVIEPGEIKVMVGPNSAELLTSSFYVGLA